MEFGFELICASVFSVSCVILAFAYRHVCKFYTYFDKMGIPGPVPSFLIGTWKEAPEKFLGDLDCQNAKLYGKVYGTFDGLTPNLMVVEPSIIKDILETHADKFDNRRVASCRNLTLKKCVAALYGDDKEHAAIYESDKSLLHTITKEVTSRLESSTTNLVTKILERKEDGVGFNFITIVNDYIHDLIASMIFGIDLNSDVTFKDEFVSYCDQVFKTTKPNSKLSLIPIAYENLQGDSWILPQRALDYFVGLIKSGINEYSKDESAKRAPTLIEIFAEAAEKEKNTKDDSDLSLTEDFIIVECLTAILALVNTAQSTILLAIQCLGNDTEVQEELSREAEKNRSGQPDLQNLNLLGVFIAEVMRLYPSEFRMERVCNENVTIDKLNLTKGDRVSIPLYALHRQEDHFPEQEKLEPRRFADEGKPKPFTYFPAGCSRSDTCSAGLILALLATKMAIFQLLVAFKFKSPDNSNRVIFQKGLTGVPKLAALNITTEVKDRAKNKEYTENE